MLAKRFEYDNVLSHEVAVWENLVADEIGDSLQLPFYGIKSTVQLTGSFDGGFIKLEQSLDGDNWYQVEGGGGGGLFAASGACMRDMKVYGLFIRPVIVGGGAETAIGCVLVVWP